jgi:hypothetical protein
VPQSPIDYDLTRRTAYEQLLLDCRVLGISRTSLARRHKTTVPTIWAHRDDTEWLLRKFHAVRGLLIRFGGAHRMDELCWLARHREVMARPWRERGLVTQELARALGVSRQRFHILEQRGDQRVVEFWQQRGFTFFKGNGRVPGSPLGQFLERPRAGEG